MTSTILSKSDLELLENILSKHGSIVDFGSIKSFLEKDNSDAEIRNKVSLLSKKGWLVRLKRGIYAVASLESHNFTGISPLAISNAMIADSYVSLEFALNYHDLFDQMPSRLTAITTSRSFTSDFQSIEYHFAKTQPKLFFGFDEVMMERRAVKIAESEKAILDFLYLRTDVYTADLMLEKLKDAKESMDFNKLIDYAAVYPLSTKRKLGFLLDLAGIDSARLYEAIRQFRSSNKLTKKSNIYNAKWRLYYENRFAK